MSLSTSPSKNGMKMKMKILKVSSTKVNDHMVLTVALVGLMAAGWIATASVQGMLNGIDRALKNL